jgi:DNA-binding PadR family transcriptional regulator
VPGNTLNLRFFILGLLAQRSLSGYDVKGYLKNLGWLIGSPSAGSIYPALRSLLQGGLVTVEVELRPDRPPRKVYTISEAGKRELDQWVDQPVGPSGSMKAFMMRLILASHYAPDRLLALMRQRRAEVARHQQELTSSRAFTGTAADLGQRMALEYALSVAHSELAWLDLELVRVSHNTSPVEVQ